MAIVEQVRTIADRVGATPAQIALAWVVAQGEQVVPIPGTKTPKYLLDNAGAAGVGADGRSPRRTRRVTRLRRASRY